MYGAPVNVVSKTPMGEQQHRDLKTRKQTLSATAPLQTDAVADTYADY